MKIITSFFFVALLCVAVKAQTGIFTYQGKLNDSSQAANGSYLLEFKLFDQSADGVQIGQTVSDVPATVVNGIFTVPLDFGTAAFDGSDRYLEISVRRSANENYTTLAPRQMISSAPYAIKSKNADSAATAVNAINSGQLGGVDANQFTRNDDPRLSDQRDPLAGSRFYINNQTTQQILSNFNISGEGKANIFSAETQFNIGANRVLSSAGTFNLFVGTEAGISNTTGGFNTFVGASAGRDNTSGEQNSFFGRGAGAGNTTGFGNSFFGRSAGLANTTGEQNSFFGQEAGFSNQANFNAFFGAQSGKNNTTGGFNSFFGAAAGFLNTTGEANSFFGTDAGRNNAAAANNAFFGAAAGRENTEGEFNSFFGARAGLNNQTAGSNSFFGFESGTATTIGRWNVFVGSRSGFSNITGANNTYVGTFAGFSSTTADNNSFFGLDAGRKTTTGNANVFVGSITGRENTTGASNTFVGNGAGLANTVGSGNTLLGSGANLGAGNLTNATAVGAGAVVAQSNSVVLGNNANVGIGTNAPQSKLTVAGLIETTSGGVKFPDGTTQTTAANFTASNFIVNSIAPQAGANFNIGGAGRANFLSANTQFNLGLDRILSAGGTNNLFVGIQAGTNNGDGTDNTFVGKGAGIANISGDGNAFFGLSAGLVNSTGIQNTFIGKLAGEDNTVGVDNAFVGRGAGANNVSGSANTALGSFTVFGTNNLQFATAIGSNSRVDTSNTIALGRNFGEDKVLIYGRLQLNELGSAGSTQLCRNAANQISTCSSSLRYKTNVARFDSGLAIVNRLRPITFDWKADGKRDLGLGAEEVAAVEENLVIRNDKGEVEGVKYDRVSVILINAVREQQAQIEAQAKQIEMLKQIICTQNPAAAICKAEEVKKDDR